MNRDTILVSIDEEAIIPAVEAQKNKKILVLLRNL